jgi:hypothetical protein
MVKTLDTNDRARLRELLERRFSLEELETLAFDLGVDYNQLAHTTTTQLSRELVSYFERRGNLNSLITGVLSQRYDDFLTQLSTKLPPGSPRTKVQIILTQEVQYNPSEIIADLAAKLKIDVDEVELIGATWGSLRLLVGLPQDAANELVNSNVHALVRGKYHVISITAFDSLDATSQEAWRSTVRKGSEQPKRQPWWNSRTLKLVATVICAALVAIPFTNIAGFFGLWLIAAGASFIIIRIMFPPEKRAFPLFCWQVCIVSFLCAVLFYESATAGALSGKLDWFSNTLFASAAGQLIGSLFLGVLLGAPIVILPMLFRAYTGVVSMLALNQIYGISRWQALRLTLSLILNVQRPVISIEEGQIKEVKPEGWPVAVGGPAILLIRPYQLLFSLNAWAELGQRLG